MSQHFEFNLQKVLELRYRLEQQAAAELGRFQSLESQARAKLTIQEKERQEQLAAWRERNHGQLDIGELEAYQRWLEVLDQVIAQQKALVEELQLSIRDQTDKYLAARRKRETLEKLREKAYAEFRQEVLGKEQRELDDIAATRFVQREAPFS
ncbi:MAG: flagellar export protein FliJ [Firmicutes bacterium]|nr:flagellar export protein FliJ [Bacillota bacterium]